MGKVCVVKSCPSGRKLKSVNNDSPQILSYFQPTTPAKLQKWKISLGLPIKATDYVCHLHFKEEHIQMDKKFTINGELKIFPTGKKLLKAEAYPTIEHQFQHNSSDQHAHDSLESLKESQTSTKVEVFPTIEHHFEQNPSGKYAHDPTENNRKSGLDSFKEKILKFSILPPSWLYIDKKTGLEFMRMDLTSRKIINHLRLNEDASVTVIFPNKEEFALNEKIDSFRDINKYLKSIEKWPVCVGTEIESMM